MQLAVHFPDFTLPGGSAAIPSVLAATAKAAEAAGVTTFTLMDHWFQMESRAPASDPMLEGYTSLGFLAGQTEQMQLGLLVTGVTYRPPGFLAKIIATLDVLSGGRAMLGIGAAWYEKEHRALGVPFPPIAERFTRLEESLQVVTQMWSDNDGPYQGHHYQLLETLCSPRPIQAPHPPILIGGGGEKKTLALVAKYADATNLFDFGPDEVAHKLDVLRGHCDAIGRDYATIEKTVISGIDPRDDYDGFVALMERYAKLGITKVWTSALAPDPVGYVTDVAEELVPRLAELADGSR